MIGRALIMLRAVLAMAVLAGVYAFALVAVAYWLFTLYAAIVGSDTSVSTTGNFVMFAAFSTIPVALTVREIARMSEPVGARPGSVLVGPEEAPGLHRAVTELARHVGTTPPAEIRVTAEAEVSVTDIGPMLGLLPGVRRLYLGAPLLACMDVTELHAVLAHELGHFARSHARFTVPVSRGSAAMTAARQRIEDVSRTNASIRMYGAVPVAIMSFYAWLFDMLTLPVRRRQERESDLIAARVVGPSPLAAGLVTAAALQRQWPWYRRHRLQDRKVTPENPFLAFAVFLAHEVDQEQTRSEVRTARPARRTPHPALADRISWVHARCRSGPDDPPVTPVQPLVLDSVFERAGKSIAADERWPTGKWILLAMIPDGGLETLQRSARTLDDVLHTARVPSPALYTICGYAILLAHRGPWRPSLWEELIRWVIAAAGSTAGMADLRSELRELGVTPADVPVPETILDGLVPPGPRVPLPRNTQPTTRQALRVAFRNPYVLIPFVLVAVLWVSGALFRSGEEQPGQPVPVVRPASTLLGCALDPARCGQRPEPAWTPPPLPWHT